MAGPGRGGLHNVRARGLSLLSVRCVCMDPLSGVPQFTPRMGLTSASANPEGCQKLAGGRSAAQTPVRVAQCVGTLEGCQKLADFLAPFQGAADDGALTGGIARCA